MIRPIACTAAVLATLAGCDRSPVAVSDSGPDRRFVSRIDGLGVDGSPADARRDDGRVDSWPKPCGAAPLAYAGPLCGPAGKPCKVEVDELVASDKSMWSSPLALDDAGQPMLGTTIGIDGFSGTVVRRSVAGAWTEEALPVQAADIQLAVNPAGQLVAYVDDGAMHQSLLRRSSGTWSTLATLPGKGWSGTGLGIDSAGCTYVFRTDSTPYEVASYYQLSSTGAWSSYAMGSGSMTAGALALAPSGAPHIVAPGTSGSGIALYWAAAPLPREQVDIVHPQPIFEERHFSVVATGSTTPGQLGTPHVAYRRRNGDGSHDVVLATRAEGSGVWTRAVVAAESPDAKCYAAPTMTGQTCDFDDVDFFPMAMLASATGEVRMLLGKVRLRGSLLAECTSGPGAPSSCVWKGEGLRERSLLLAWLTAAGTAEQVTLSSDAQPAATTADDRWDVSAAIGADGRIHIAEGAVDLPAAATIRYLRLAPVL
jgi:hypothetical protein